MVAEMSEVLKGGNAPLHMVITSPFFRASAVNQTYDVSDEKRAEKNAKMRVYNATIRKERKLKCLGAR